MKKSLIGMAMLAIWPVALAQAPEGEASARARIEAERSQAEARYAAEEKACFARFAVNDCQNEARVRRRAVLADLRRQEVSLNDAERRRKSVQKLREIEERSSPEKQRQADEQQAKALAEQQEREAHAAEKAAGRKTAAAPSAAKSPERPFRDPRKKAMQKTPNERQSPNTAEKRKSFEGRLEEAQARKGRIEKRLAERNKTAPKPLPVPP